MSERRGALLLFFDLPSTDKKSRRAYTAFKKYLKTEGYTSLQESVYVKLIRNTSQFSRETEKLKANVPAQGSVMILPLCLSSFSQLDVLVGSGFDMSLFADDTVFI